jgi:D-glycero-D-manno-heptose 1,7-bisphosphate phosphatase
MSDSDLNILHTKMKKRIEHSGGKINKIYYCPHLEEFDCLCRKPRPGMIEHALLDLPEIVLEDSYLIGDSDSDIEAGKRMNLSTVKVDNEYTLAKWTAELLFVL